MLFWLSRQKAENDRRTRLIADKAKKQIDELLKDAQEVDFAPSGFAQFVIDKVKGKYPQFYTNCERAWQAIRNKRDVSKDRARHIMDMVAEWDNPKDDEDQYQ